MYFLADRMHCVIMVHAWITSEIATGDRGVTMHWTQASYFRHVVLKQGLQIYGMPSGTVLQDPAKIRNLTTLSRLIKLWNSDKIRFTQVDPTELESMRATAKEKGSVAGHHGPSPFRGKRRPMRKVATVGLKAKGPIKSAEFVSDSDMDEAAREGTSKM